MQYSQEYRFADITDSLENFVNQTAGKYINNLSGIFDSKLEEVTAYKNITLPLLIAAVIFLIIDIVYRRLDIKLGAKLFAVVQSKFTVLSAAAQARSAAKEEITENSTTVIDSSTTVQPPKKSEGKPNHKKHKKKEDSQEMLDVGSLLKKQKERAR